MSKPYWRLLRSFTVRMSLNTYECKRCYQDINPGEGYTGYVYVSIYHNILTEREHEFCDGPWDDWEDWEDWDGEDDLGIMKEEEPLPLAA